MRAPLLRAASTTRTTDDKPETILVKEGEMVFTPPMVDHGMTFPEDTVFLTLSRNPRDQESYEKDVVRVDMMPSEGLTTWKPGDPMGDDK